MISIIVVSYNTRDLLRECLQSISAHEPDAQVVVVDNASRDGSAGMVRDEFPGVALVELDANRGFAGGNNAGYPLCQGDPIVLLNSDAVLVDDSLSRCARRLREAPALGAVSPRVVGMDGVEQDARHRVPGLFEYAKIALRRPPSPATGTGPADDGRWYLAGTALVLRRSAIESISALFDESYFIYWEDADLSARLKAAGWGLEYVPDAHVLHHGGASGGGPTSTSRVDLAMWYFHGHLRYCARNMPIWESTAIWVGDALESIRSLGRMAIRPSRRGEFGLATARLRVLGLSLLGRSPARPFAAGAPPGDRRA